MLLADYDFYYLFFPAKLWQLYNFWWFDIWLTNIRLPHLFWVNWDIYSHSLQMTKWHFGMDLTKVRTEVWHNCKATLRLFLGQCRVYRLRKMHLKHIVFAGSLKSNLQ